MRPYEKPGGGQRKKSSGRHNGLLTHEWEQWILLKSSAESAVLTLSVETAIGT